MPSKALEMGVCFHRAPVLGKMGGSSFPSAFERRVTFFIRRSRMEVFERYVKKDLKTGNSLHGGPLWGTWRGFVYRDF